MPKQFHHLQCQEGISERIVLHYFRIIDPTSKNRQGNDQGTQYRTGVYYVSQEDLPTINQVFEEEAKI